MEINKIINPRFEEYIYNWDHKFYFCFGGYGSSKSYNTALKIILKLLQEKRKCLVIREVYSTHRDSTFSLFKEIISDMGLSDYITNKVSPLQIDFPNGSQIIFRGMDNPEKLKSINDITIVFNI
jgi:phage terminase large subunit